MLDCHPAAGQAKWIKTQSRQERWPIGKQAADLNGSGLAYQGYLQQQRGQRVNFDDITQADSGSDMQRGANPTTRVSVHKEWKLT